MKKIKSLGLMLLTMTFALATSAVAAVSISAPLCYVSDNMANLPQISVLLTIGIYSFSLVSEFKFTKNYAFSAPFSFTEGICPDIQVALNDLMGANSPEQKRTPVGYLQAITSPANTAGLNVIPIDSSNGKKHKVRVTYAQRGTEDDLQTSYNSGCDAEISKVPYEDTIEITDVLSLKGLAFSEDEMRKLCDSDKTWIARQINAHLDPFMTKLNKLLITKQNGKFGNFAGGSNSVVTRQLLNVVSGANINPNYNGENMIMNDFEDIGFSGRPILIGSGKLRSYVNLTNHGCCNASGIDNGTAGDFDYFNDRFVGGITGNADDFIGLAPGNVQLLTYNKYKGDYVKRNDSFVKTTIIDPFTGLELDMRWKYNDCDEVWILTFSLYHELFFLPANAFATGDDYEGVNYTLHYRATQA